MAADAFASAIETGLGWMSPTVAQRGTPYLLQ
jgi:hypothetical protein